MSGLHLLCSQSSGESLSLILFLPSPHVGMVGTRRLNEWYQKDFGGKEMPSVACLQQELHAKVKLDRNPQGL